VLITRHNIVKLLISEELIFMSAIFFFVI